MQQDNNLDVGDRAQIKATGNWVNIERVSAHGIAVVRYDMGYRRMIAVKELKKATPLAEMMVA